MRYSQVVVSNSIFLEPIDSVQPPLLDGFVRVEVLLMLLQHPLLHTVVGIDGRALLPFLGFFVHVLSWLPLRSVLLPDILVWSIVSANRL